MKWLRLNINVLPYKQFKVYIVVIEKDTRVTEEAQSNSRRPAVHTLAMLTAVK